MNRSPLHDIHANLGARFVDFGGWQMPVRYGSVLAEHEAVRTAAGFFDVSHLGRFELTGPGAHEAMRKLLCNDIDRIEPGRCQYTMVLNPDGGIIDDMIVWWWDEETFWLLPNAVNQHRVMAMFADEPDTRVADLQMRTVMIAVQGPDAPGVLERLAGSRPGRFKTATGELDGAVLAMAGTGYTGETGGEICVEPEAGRRLLQALVDHGVKACGLGSRDTLRLEAGLTLWGSDIDETTTPLEAGLDFAVAFDHEFVGRDALAKQLEDGLSRKLVGFVMTDRGVPRAGYPIRTTSGGEGYVTSGNISPALDTGIGLAYITPPPETDESLHVGIRNRWVRGHLTEPPFHERGK